MAIMSPLIPGFQPMQMNVQQMKQGGMFGGQNADMLKALLAAASKQPAKPNAGIGAAAANTGMPGGGYSGPGGEVQPGPGFYPPAGGGGLLGMLGGAGGAGGAGAGAGGLMAMLQNPGSMGLLGKLFGNPQGPAPGMMQGASPVEW